MATLARRGMWRRFALKQHRVGRADVPGLTFAGGLVAVLIGCHAPPVDRRDAVPKPEASVEALPQTGESAPLLGPPRSVGMRSGLVVLAPGADCGWHSTDDYEELVICLEGNGEVRSEGSATRPVAAGQFAYNPPRTRHCIYNTGATTMRYVYVVAPAQSVSKQQRAGRP
jgi:quercetin dioxygenase-like cupin family protein